MTEDTRRLQKQTDLRAASITVDFTAPELGAAWKDVLDGKETWMLASYESKSKLKLVGKGSGGFAELVDALSDDEVMYAGFKYEQGRTKFCFLSWVGENVGGMKKARASQDISSVKHLIDPIHNEINALSRDDITPEAVRGRLGADAEF